MFMYAVLILIPALTFAQQHDPAHDALEKAIFDHLDGDKDGKISEAENENAFLAYDTDKDGEVSEAEFTAGIDKISPDLAGHEDALYKLLDHDSNNKVDKADIDNAFTAADANGDGEIEKPEFHAIFDNVVTHVG